jgi:2-polyprenyl-3-methyl-5-hydroxy-6-metoxy-1,4-benzoquinol methylase
MRLAYKTYFSVLCAVLLLFGNNTSANDEIRKLWDHRAHQWKEYLGKDAENDLNRKFQLDPALLKAIGNLTGKVVLDAGSGTGYLSSLMAKNAKKVFGIDISEEMVKISKVSYSDHNIDFIAGDLSKLEKIIPSNFIDIIVSHNVLMDLPDLEGSVAYSFDSSFIAQKSRFWILCGHEYSKILKC